jgi:hypothetical protein
MSFKYTESEKKEFNKKLKETKMVCHCGGKFTSLRENKNKHALTKKYIKYLSTTTDINEFINSSLMLSRM